MSTVVKGLAPTLESQLPEGSLARRAVSGLKSAADWLGLSDDASVETSTMGPIGPAVSLVTKRPLEALRRQLAPTRFDKTMMRPVPTSAGEFPNVYEAIGEAVERFPSTLSHVAGTTLDLAGQTLGGFEVPGRVAKLLQGAPKRAWRSIIGDEPVARIHLNPVIEQSRKQALDTVFHETGHAGQFLNDPARWKDTYDAVQGRMTRLLTPSYGILDAPTAAYHLNPSEVGVRAIGDRQSNRVLGLPVDNYRQAIADAIYHPNFPGRYSEQLLRDVWRQSREGLAGRR